MGGHGHQEGGQGAGGVSSGMRRRPVDTTKKLPLIRSQKELDLGDDTKVSAEAVRCQTNECAPARPRLVKAPRWRLPPLPQPLEARRAPG